MNNVLLLMTPQVIDNFKKNTGAQNVSFVCITDGESSPTYYNDKHVNYDALSVEDQSISIMKLL